jgi:hypothetical protein
VRTSLAHRRLLERGEQVEGNKVLLRVSARFRLGGMLLLQRKQRAPEEEPEPEEDEEDEQHHDMRDILMKLVCGVQITLQGDEGAVYRPPFLSYAYAPETPVLLEGSILR